MPEEMKAYSGPLAMLLERCGTIGGSEDKGRALTMVRNEWRAHLRAAFPREYAPGIGGVDVFTLSQHVMGAALHWLDAETECSGCGAIEVDPDLTKKVVTKFNVITDWQTVREWLLESTQSVGDCVVCGKDKYIIQDLPEVLCLQVSGMTRVDWRLDVTSVEMYRLVGLIYHGGFHFVSRVITVGGKVYSHDGIVGTTSTFDGLLGEDGFGEDDLGTCGGRPVTLAIYVAE
jgi:hypothetical protein